MTDLRTTLQPLLDAEQRSPGPTPEVIDELWARIAADHRRGALPELDVPPPARPRRPYLWLALGLLGAGLVAGSLYLARPHSRPEPTLPNPTRPATTPAIAPPPALDPPPPPDIPELAEPPISPQPPAPETATKPATKPRPTRPASATSETDTFAEELRLLARGQAALSRDDHAEALRIADRYQKTYPRGHFSEDRDALRVLALCESRSTKATPAADHFLQKFPNSIHASRIREACQTAPP